MVRQTLVMFYILYTLNIDVDLEAFNFKKFMPLVVVTNLSVIIRTKLWLWYLCILSNLHSVSFTVHNNSDVSEASSRTRL